MGLLGGIARGGARLFGGAARLGAGAARGIGRIGLGAARGVGRIGLGAARGAGRIGMGAARGAGRLLGFGQGFGGGGPRAIGQDNFAARPEGIRSGLNFGGGGAFCAPGGG
ncbi:MAG: hypothetical protein FJZ00_01775 [Candidatus Sericytochromatia bacterium]|uniref:Uncharacterized protein n=1 Tax=Candidatus Tanganyikabacteria bacterium TaxID=2961651 RepID=A0A937X226_9BACT|nr:hypothetical protein [Candidatus Tanganyikabacteria bacterium]